MFHDVPPSSKILEGYRSFTPSGPRPLTEEFQAILAEADKAKKGGRGSKKATKKDTAKKGPSEAAKPPSKKRKAPAASTAAPKRRKQPAKRRKSPTHTPSQSEGVNSESDTESEIRIEEDPPIRNAEDEPVRTEEQEHVHNEEGEQVHNEPPVRTEAPSPNRELILASKVSTSEAYSKAAVESILDRVTKEHTANVSTLSNVVSDSTSVCKSPTEKVVKLIADTIEFMEDYKNTYNANTVTAKKAIHNVGAMFQAEKANFVELHKAF
ncbi:unnamed protein product [Lactuca virosa]|uniref:Uncharacterized protein n=1 Tax=Lactuca virosa TaxID=75947 RepID=A0AAU9NE66_9ASTR|nr:unnamed protein product [Lactuca virosa]